MKKLISWLLVVVMLFTAVGVFAETSEGEDNILMEFLKETDYETKDIAFQIQSGTKISDLVIRVDGDTVHLVSRNNYVVDDHIQIDPTGVYVASGDSVTLLRHATVTTAMERLVTLMDAALEEAIKAEALALEEEREAALSEIKTAVDEMSVLAPAMEAQEQADAATLSAAAMSFADKFKPEYILDVEGEEGHAQVSLRGEAFADAFADAMDELMSNPDLAELVDRKAALNGGKEFAAFQLEWINNREAFLETLRSIESVDAIDENGHWTSHFEMADDSAANQILACDLDAWIDPEKGETYINAAMGVKDDDPLMVYELAVDQYSYREKMTSGNSTTDIRVNYDENHRINYGSVVVVLEGVEQLREEIGPDYLYIKGPKGGFSTSVRKTWTGKLRYELYGETADGQQKSVTIDFYEDVDSLVCELNASESDVSAMFKVSRVNKVDIQDLSTAKNIDEITVEEINDELEPLVKMIAGVDFSVDAKTPEDEVIEVNVDLPAENGMFGIYKWVEMEKHGLKFYLILWDDGMGFTDIVGTGTVRGVFYDVDAKTMQVADEGAVPQTYTYADGKLTWSYTDESGVHTSTFVKLTADERAAYEAIGVGTVLKTEG